MLDFNNVITPVQYSLASSVDIVKEENVFLGHKGSVSSATFSPNGKMIVSGGEDTTIRLWDLQGNLIKEPFRGHEAKVTSVAFSPNGKLIVSGSEDKTIRLWDLQGNLIRVIKKAGEFHDLVNANNVFFISEEQIIRAGSMGIDIFNINGKHIKRIGRFNESCSVAFSPSKEIIVSAGGCQPGTLPVIRIKLINVDKSFNELDSKTFFEHTGAVSSIAFSPDKIRFVSGGVDNTVRIWDTSIDKQEFLLMGHQGAVNSVSFSPNRNQIISASNDGTIRLWNLEHRREIIDLSYTHIYQYSNHEYPNYFDFVRSLAFSIDNNLVAVAREETVQLWDIRNNSLSQPLIAQSTVNSVSFSPDGNLIAGGTLDTNIRLWDIKGNLMGEPFKGHRDSVDAVAFSPNGQMIVSGSRDMTLRLWSLRGDNIGTPFQGHKAGVSSVSFSPNGQMIVSGSDDKTIGLWDLKGNQLEHFFKGHQDSINSVAFSPNGQMIVSGSDDKTIILWDLKGNFIRQLVGHPSAVKSLSFSPDGETIVSSDLNGTLKFWDINGNATYPSIKEESSLFLSDSQVVFSPDGKMIAASKSSKFHGSLQLFPSNWQSLLKVGCDKLLHHPVFTNPQTEVQQEAKLVCQKYAWSKK